jgi:NADPH-dependent curcumin reductase CurA
MTIGFDETTGIENVLLAFGHFMTGKNTGKVIVDIR